MELLISTKEPRKLLWDRQYRKSLVRVCNSLREKVGAVGAGDIDGPFPQNLQLFDILFLSAAEFRGVPVRVRST